MTFGDSRLPARFWDKVQPEPNSGCWLWLAGSNQYGYGTFYAGRTVAAHKLAYVSLVGPVPQGTELDHVKARGCCGPCCVNPAHLESVTHHENTLRGDAPTAVNAVKTHCIHGHRFDVDNTYRTPLGGRHCRVCKRDRDAVYRAKRTGG